MKITVEPGRYVVAVSGGVDSMALLHLLKQLPDVQIVVAHFDHGIREDSLQDRLLVQQVAKAYKLPFVYGSGNLGSRVSEAEARQARYNFLHKVREASGSRAIITAHHKDDALETAIINMIRGTGRRGLTSLKSTDIVKRPLLQYPKADLMDYAKARKLQWREDSTNSSTAYLRNHIRRNVLTRFSPADKQKLHDILNTVHAVNQEADKIIQEFLQRNSYGNRLKRHEFIQLPHAAALEVMAAWLRTNNIRGFDKKMLERLVQGAKIHRVGREIPIDSGTKLRINKVFLALEHVER
jgi:tRNA(Ile)-lysidine synthetase-like protein